MRTRAVVGVLACLLSIRANAQGTPNEKIQTLPGVLDTAIPAMMAERHIPGAAIAVVHQGKVIYLRGFGEAVVGSGQSVDTASTTFRVGSVSKLFTAIAALLLVDAGKLDLQKDVAGYAPDLGLRYPTTMHQLLSHTAGIDERFAGAYTDSSAIPSLSDHLRLSPPRQVFQPGTAYSYSNYNYAVVGAVIERLSGQRFEDYVAEHVLAPLGMKATTAHQPPPEGTAGSVARGYRWDDGQQRAMPIRYTFASASGGITTSVADMSRFLIALLDGGAPRILSADSLRAFFAEQYSPHPRIAGVSYGAIHWRTRGRDLIFKDGTLGDQLGAVVLDPAIGFGVFIASNALPGIEPILEPLLNHVYGSSPSATPPVLLTGTGSSARFTGVFRDLHHTRNDMSRLRALMPIIQTRVNSGPDGSVRWQGRSWVQVEPLLFQSADGADHIVFRENADGTIATLHSWGATYERIGIFEQTLFHLTVLVSCVLSFGSYVVFRFKRRRRELALSQWSNLARRAGALLAGLNLLFVAILIPLIGDLGGSVPLPVTIRIWLALPIASLALTIVVAVFSVVSWRRGWWTSGERVGYSTFATSAIVFMVFLNHWMLLGYRY